MNNLPTFFDRKFNRGPLRDLRNMTRQMDRLFDQAWNSGGMDFGIEPMNAPEFTPTCDVNESDSHYLMSFDLPGVKKEDIKIDLRDNTLTVSGERKEEHEEQKSGRFRSERFFGRFERSFTLPTDVKADQIEANYADGVLNVAIPKREAAQAQQIKIGEGKASSAGGKTPALERSNEQRQDESKRAQTH